MKLKLSRVIAFLLAAVMLFALAACGGGSTPPKTDPSANPDNTPANTGDQNQPAGEDPSENYNDIGFFESGVDPKSRETYNIVYSYMRPMSLFQQINDDLVEMEPVLNYKTTAYCANSDIDALIQNIQLYANQGADGFIIVIDPTASDRICQVLDETGKPYIALINTVKDEEGHEIKPAVALEGISAGKTIVNWMFDNYKDILGDIDINKVGLLNFNWSLNNDFQDRFDGAKAAYLEKLPGNENMVFEADGASGKLDEQTGYDLATATLSAHPEIEYWFIPCCLEQYAQGATRAVEALGMEDKVIIVDISGDLLPREWDGGYEGCWAAALALPSLVYAVPSICGLISMIDGKSTPETLWANERAEGDVYTNFNTSSIGSMITKDMYKDYFAKIREMAGLS